MPSTVASTPQQLAELGLTPGLVEPWEDGLRTDPAATSWEWWYLDCLTEDGSKLTVEFHTKPPHVSPRGSLTPFVSFTLDRADGTNVVRTVTAQPEEFSAATDGCDVAIGANRFRGDLHRYEVHVELDGLTADLELVSELRPFRPEGGHVLCGDAHVAWLCAVPRGGVTGTVTIDGETLKIRGTGYHDHNWGTAPLRTLIDHWYWGRARVGDYTVVTLNFVSHADHGRNVHPVLFLAKGDEVLVETVGDVAFEVHEIAMTATTGVPAGRRFSYRHDAGYASFAVHFARECDVFALDFGRHGAYDRFTGEVTVERSAGGEVVDRASGEALWELLWFGARDAATAPAPPPADGLVHQA